MNIDLPRLETILRFSSLRPDAVVAQRERRPRKPFDIVRRRAMKLITTKAWCARHPARWRQIHRAAGLKYVRKKRLENAMKLLKDNEIFVFGSSRADIFKKGAAKMAKLYFGADASVGPTGRCYAIPVRDALNNPMILEDIADGVRKFLIYARQLPEKRFVVTRIACGQKKLGYETADIAPLFRDAPGNVQLHDEFRQALTGALPSCQPA